MPSVWTEGGLTSLAAAAAAAAAAGSSANDVLLFSELAADDSSMAAGDQQQVQQQAAGLSMAADQQMTPDELIDYISKEFSGPLGENTNTQTAARKLLMIRRYFAEFPFT